MYRLTSLLVTVAILFYSVKCECPFIVSRQEWNASHPSSIRLLEQSPPPYVVVHHSATISCQTQEDCKHLVKSIQRFHMEVRKWEDIGYNFLIGNDGYIYEGRGWGIHGAHVINYNSRSIGICLLGNYQVMDPPILQLEALKELIECAKETNKTTKDYHLIGHRQGSATLCPGDKLFKIIEDWPHFDKYPV